MTLLKFALTGNAGFSLLCGFLLTLAPRSIAGVFQSTNYIPFLVIGLGLLYFAYTIIVEIKPQRRNKVLWIIAQDLLWVIGSLAVLLTRPFDISAVGYNWIAWIAAIVLSFGLLQAVGWWQTKNRVLE